MKKFWKKKKKEKPKKTEQEISPAEEEKTESQPAQGQNYSLSKDVYNLIVKMMEVIALVGLLYVFIFGVYQNRDLSMAPALQDGDLVIYYKLDKNYLISDTIVVEYEGKKQTRRVVAKAGDVVDITDRGLEVNGSLQQEDHIYEDTLLYKDQVKFPLTVEPGQVFVLGDARETAVDSRVYGPVKVDDTLGQVFCIVRRRSI